MPPSYPKLDGDIVFDSSTSLAGEGAFVKLVRSEQRLANHARNALYTLTSPQPNLLSNDNNEQGYYILPALTAEAST